MGRRVNKRSSPPEYSKIAEYWHDKYITKEIKVCDQYEKDAIPVILDWKEPACWGCGIFNDQLYVDPSYSELSKMNNNWEVWNLPSAKLCYQRAHIIPHSGGGSNELSNYFLLCRQCHQESPDMMNSEYFFAYIYDIRQRTILSERINQLIHIIIKMAKYLDVDFDITRDLDIVLSILRSSSGNYINEAVNPMTTSIYTQAATILDCFRTANRENMK